MADLGDAVVDIRASFDEFKKDLRNAKTRVNAATKDMSKSFDKIGGGISKAGGAMTKMVTGPIAAVSAAVGGLIFQAGRYADALLDQAAATGVSVEKLQEYQAQAAAAGTSSDAAAQATGQLNQFMFRASRGLSRSTEALKRLGLSYEDLENLTPDERMKKINKALNTQVDASERAQLGSIIYTSAWKDYAPIATQSQEALDKQSQKLKEQGLILSKDQVDSLNSFRSEWDKATFALKQAGNVVAAELAPHMKTLAAFIQENAVPTILNLKDRAIEIIRQFQNMDKEVIKNKAKLVALTAALGPLIKIVGIAIQWFGKIRKALAVLRAIFLVTNATIFIVIAIIGLLVAAIVDLWKNNEEFRNKVKAIWADLKAFFNVVAPFIKDVIVAAFKGLTSIVQGIVRFLVNFLVGDWQGMADAWESIGQGILDTITGIFGAMWDHIGPVLSDLGREILSFFTGLAGDAVQKGRDVIGGVIDGMRDMIQKAKDIADNVTGAIARFLPGSEPKEGPLKGLEKKGQEMTKLFTKGMSDEMQKQKLRVESSIGGMERGINPAMLGNQLANGTGEQRPVVNINNQNQMSEEQVMRAVNRALRMFAVNFSTN